MDEKQAQGTAHRVMIQGRHSGTISGVSDVLSFDLNEIVLQTTQGMLMIRGQELHMNRLTLEKGEVDIEGKIDSFVYSEQKGENGKDNLLSWTAVPVMHTVIAAEALFLCWPLQKEQVSCWATISCVRFAEDFRTGAGLSQQKTFFYWVFAWIFVFLMFRDRNYGQIRGYVLAALILGMLFYILLFSRRILLVFSTFFGFLSRMIAGLFRLILMPAGKSVKKIEKNGQESIEKRR